MAGPLVALTLDSAKQIGVALVIGFVVLSIVAATVIKNITTKIITTLLLAGFALGVWTQRANVQDCAADVRANAAVGDTTVTTCRFFGTDIDVPDVAP